MLTKVRSTRRNFISSAALAAAAMPLGVQAQQLPLPARAGDTKEPGCGFQMDLWCLPRVQFWGFDNKDPVLDALGFSFSVQIMTVGPDENTYSLHAGSIRKTKESSGVTIHAGQLASAGQQAQVDGECEIRLTQQGESTRVTLSANCAKAHVRAVKMILHGLPAGRVGFTSWEDVVNLAPVPVEALALSYPSYQGGAPVWFLATEGERGISFSALDVTARPRRFVAALEPNGGTHVELIAEQDARHWTNSFTAPVWELRRHTTLDEAIDSRVELLEKEAGLRAWERRGDVPAWVYDIGLVVCLHGMHWSGYIFNDYEKMRASIDWVTERIPGKHVLFFLSGWEGRYYRSYGNSVPNAEMGGNAGFRRLMEFAHSRGAHVMAMYAGNAAMPGTPGFAQYAPGSHFESDDNLRWTPLRGYVTDWFTVRGTDTGGAEWLNPGAPGWQHHLTEQVRAIVREYKIDGAFFDTQPNTGNDRRYQPIDGLRKIVGDLRGESPNLMIATESWLDTTYSFLHAGQTPAGYKNWSSRFGRRFAHLAMGEPSRGSTGVHELGHCEYNFDQLMTIFDWPTLAIVDTTLRDAPEKAARVVDYAKMRLKKS